MFIYEFHNMNELTGFSSKNKDKNKNMYQTSYDCNQISFQKQTSTKLNMHLEIKKNN